MKEGIRKDDEKIMIIKLQVIFIGFIGLRSLV